MEGTGNPLACLSGESEPQLRRGYVDTSAGQIHYRTLGHGHPLVLLHQTPSSSVMWERFMKYFPAGYRLVAFDSPGFGMSDMPVRPMAMAGYASVLLEAMTQFNISDAIVLGHHTGASIAVEIARQEPGRVKGLVLMGPFAPLTTEQLKWWKNKVHHWQPDAKGAFLNEAVLPRLNAVSAEADGQQYLFELIAHLQAGPHFWWAYDAVFDYDLAERVGDISVQTLILTGERELSSQVEMGRLVHSLIAKSEYQMIPGGTSEMVSEVPESVRDKVLPFVEKVLKLC